MSRARLAALRCDAGYRLGGGHVSRCLALADALGRRGWTCRFASLRGSADIVPALARSGWDICDLDEPESPASQVGAAVGAPVDLLVVDHYGLDAAFEREARAWAGRVAVIDDLADRAHDCDLLLDQTAGRAPSDYAPWVPAHAILLLGAEYALLRPDFAVVRNDALARRDGRVRRIHVCMGASDPHGLSERAVRAVSAWGGDAAVDVVLGSAGDLSPGLRAAIREARVPVHVHVATPDMAPLMAQADLAIGSAGIVSWERCAVGLPTIVTITAENQRLIARRLVEQGAAVCVGDWRSATPHDIARALAALAADPSGLKDMAVSAAGLCDGEGVERVATRLAELAP